ncbi:MAG: alkaline phosphatase family protein [Planctomycetota bacterium]|jgi:hypothetical protein
MRLQHRGFSRHLGRALALWSVLAAASCADSSRRSRVLIVVVDGLRPDYVTPEVMPRLSALGDSGFLGENHHSVFPTATRVNSSSISTGSYPRTHGMLGNTIYLPWVDYSRVLNTGDAAALRLIADAADGQLLTAPSLAELLESHGKTLFAVSSGSSGSGMLMNHRGAGGGLAHPELFLPAGPCWGRHRPWRPRLSTSCAGPSARCFSTASTPSTRTP